MMKIDFDEFCNTFAVSIDCATFQKVIQRAKRKRNYIISRFGDGNGARLTQKYMLELMRDELASVIAENMSKEMLKCCIEA